jgi:hypothetical protein
MRYEITESVHVELYDGRGPIVADLDAGQVDAGDVDPAVLVLLVNSGVAQVVDAPAKVKGKSPDSKETDDAAE